MRHQELLEQAPADVAERLVDLACLAPSVHNTQPWLWRYDGRRLVLEADPSRRLSAEDPRGRNLTISCGAALHHLQFAARALGWDTTVVLQPAGRGEHVLAEVLVSRSGRRPVVREDLDVLRARCTDRRRFTAWPVPDDRLQDLCTVADLWDARAAAITTDAGRFRLELLANRALTFLEIDGRRLLEQERWIDRPGIEGHGVDGIPIDVLPDTPDALQTRSRFRPGLLEDSRMVIHGGDRVIALGGATDDPAAWLRTGQAMSAVWLEATRQGMSLIPMSQPIEVDSTRHEITRSVLGDAFQPHLLLRIGWQAIGRSGLPRTPRRPLTDVLLKD